MNAGNDSASCAVHDIGIESRPGLKMIVTTLDNRTPADKKD
jgi:hypothetical protein